MIAQSDLLIFSNLQYESPRILIRLYTNSLQDFGIRWHSRFVQDDFPHFIYNNDCSVNTLPILFQSIICRRNGPITINQQLERKRIFDTKFLVGSKRSRIYAEDLRICRLELGSVITQSRKLAGSARSIVRRIKNQNDVSLPKKAG